MHRQADRLEKEEDMPMPSLYEFIIHTHLLNWNALEIDGFAFPIFDPHTHGDENISVPCVS